MRTVICDPAGIVGPISVPDLGCFAPGEHEVTDAAAERLLATPHFRPAYSAPNKSAESTLDSGDSPAAPAESAGEPATFTRNVARSAATGSSTTRRR